MVTGDDVFRAELTDALRSEFRVLRPEKGEDAERAADVLLVELDSQGSGARGVLDLLEDLR